TSLRRIMKCGEAGVHKPVAVMVPDPRSAAVAPKVSVQVPLHKAPQFGKATVMSNPMSIPKPETVSVVVAPDDTATVSDAIVATVPVVVAATASPNSSSHAAAAATTIAPAAIALPAMKAPFRDRSGDEHVGFPPDRL